MKTLSALLLVLATTLPSAAKTFEGVVHYTLTSGKTTMTNEYAIKADRMRMDMNTTGKQASTGIFHLETGEVFILMPEQKMYMVFGGAKELADDAMAKEATIEETGRTESIAGHTCQEYVIKDKDSTIELWATKGLGRYVSFADVQRNRGRSPAWAQALVEKELFPLRTIIKDRRGRVQTTMEATKVEPKKLNASLFEIPADYQRFQLPNLGGLLKGLGG